MPLTLSYEEVTLVGAWHINHRYYDRLRIWESDRELREVTLPMNNLFLPISTQRKKKAKVHEFYFLRKA